jgi:hypothetical protein
VSDISSDDRLSGVEGLANVTGLLSECKTALRGRVMIGEFIVINDDFGGTILGVE